MKINKQHGFSVVEGLLILVIVGIVGGTGWYVMTANKNADESLSNAGLGTAVSTKKQTKATTKDVPDNWTSYSDSPGQFSFSYPSNWTKNVCDSADLKDQGVVLLGAEPSKAGACQSDGVPQISISGLSGDSRSDYSLTKDYYPDLKSESITVNGVKGQKQIGTYTMSSEPAAIGPSNGTKTTVYLFYANARTFALRYQQDPAWADISSDVNKLVTTTLKFSAK
jgi:type II secretory pathway pseudopilin PulG